MSIFNDWFQSANAYVLMPFIGAVLLAIVPLGRRASAYIALLVSLVTTGGILGLAYRFDGGQGVQYATDESWIPDLGIRYHVGIDGLSLALMSVTAVVLLCAIGYAMWDERGGRSRTYFSLMLLLQGALMLLFCARDLLLFYVGFEAMLIPLYFLVAIWGGPERRAATLKFVLYTVIGTLLMLVAMIDLALHVPDGPSFAYSDLAGAGGTWQFLLFIVAFAIKAPVWPLHGWVADAYRQAPPEVAAVLSGVASKAGAYAMIAIVIPIFPVEVADWRWVLITLGTVGLLYGSLLAFRQPDSRGVVAYSSIGQMGLITLGIFLLTDHGFTGAAFQMVNHALVSAALFLLAGWIERQTGTGEFSLLGGMARGRPVLATVVMIVGMAALAVPGSSVFASELVVLLAAFEEEWWLGAIASLAIVLAAMYMLRFISAVLHDRQSTAVANAAARDLALVPEARGRRQADYSLLPVLPLVLALLALSLYPHAVTQRIDPDLGKLAAIAAQEGAR